MKTHGDPGWESLPSYLDIVVPRVLEFLAKRGLTITFFVVGQDAALEKNREAFAALASSGHEIGNHSFHHEPWLHLYSEDAIEREIASAEEAITGACGRRPAGFRGPGYSLSPATLRALARRSYLYDASTLPTFLGPLARAYYFATSRLTDEEKEQRRILFGSLADGLRPIKPYRWKLGEHELLEIPVTTLPIARVPIHLSYVLYLSRLSPVVALSYFRTALGLCRALGVAPSILLHPLDFLCGADCDALSFFPAMELPLERKLAVVDSALDAFARHFEIVTLERHARALLDAGPLPIESRLPEPRRPASQPAGTAAWRASSSSPKRNTESPR